MAGLKVVGLVGLLVVTIKAVAMVGSMAREAKVLLLLEEAEAGLRASELLSGSSQVS